jgi:hypothetical protein
VEPGRLEHLRVLGKDDVLVLGLLLVGGLLDVLAQRGVVAPRRREARRGALLARDLLDGAALRNLLGALSAGGALADLAARDAGVVDLQDVARLGGPLAAGLLRLVLADDLLALRERLGEVRAPRDGAPLRRVVGALGARGARLLTSSLAGVRRSVPATRSRRLGARRAGAASA